MAKKSKKDKSGESDGYRLIENNKVARRNYEIVDTIEAGIQLLGSEVKSIRSSGVSLRDSYVRVRQGQCFLIGAHITPYTFSREDAHEPYRDRKLLLHKKQIERFDVQVKQKGLTLVPLKLYFTKEGRCKLEVGVGRGKKLHDKREDLKQRDAEREMARARSSRR